MDSELECDHVLCKVFSRQGDEVKCQGKGCCGVSSVSGNPRGFLMKSRSSASVPVYYLQGTVSFILNRNVKLN